MSIKFEFFQDGLITWKELVPMLLMVLTVYVIVVAPLLGIVYTDWTIGIVVGGLVTSAGITVVKK